MPDITMCTNTKCPLLHKCYRAQASSNKFIQSYAEFKLTKSGFCYHFWPLPKHMRTKNEQE